MNAKGAWCAACGRPVRWTLRGGRWQVGRCPEHPQAKRLPAGWFAKRFAELREVLR